MPPVGRFSKKFFKTKVIFLIFAFFKIKLSFLQNLLIVGVMGLFKGLNAKMV
jgi:hypothetical protein